MSVRREASPPKHNLELTVKQRLSLFKNTSVSNEAALTTPESEISFELLARSGVQAVNIQAAGIRISDLQNMGVSTARQLRRLGFDALHLVDPVLCYDANSVFGAAEVVAAFLCTPQDAVALAGSDAITTLNLTMEPLLQLCAGAPTEALAVLQQSEKKNPLCGVNAQTLLDTGLRAKQLCALGFSIASMRELVDLGPRDLFKLGFSI